MPMRGALTLTLSLLRLLLLLLLLPLSLLSVLILLMLEYNIPLSALLPLLFMVETSPLHSYLTTTALLQDMNDGIGEKFAYIIMYFCMYVNRVRKETGTALRCWLSFLSKLKIGNRPKIVLEWIRSKRRADVEFGVPGYGMELNIHIHMEEGDPFIVPSTLIWSMSDCCDLFCRAETPVRQQSALHDDEKDVVHKDHQV